MIRFKLISIDEIKKYINEIKNITSDNDPLPVWFIKENHPEFLHLFFKLINTSLITGVFPENLKQSIVIPTYKKKMTKMIYQIIYH